MVVATGIKETKMSRDLIEIEENCDGQDITLEVNDKNHAQLAILGRGRGYHLTPNSEGVEQAEAIIKGLKMWIETVRGNLPKDLL